MKTTSLRILHTSDWHIGRTLYGRRRYETFSAFLDWLADTVRDRHVDVLIVAGDVFDTSAPSNRSKNNWSGCAFGNFLITDIAQHRYRDGS